MPPKLLALLTALALVVAACGGDSDDTAPDSAGEDAAATTTTVVESPPAESDRATTFEDLALRSGDEAVRFEGVLSLEEVPGAEPGRAVEILVAGSADPAADASQVSMDLSQMAEAALSGDGGGDAPEGLAAFFDDPLEIITVGGTSWMRGSLLSLVLGVDDAWVELDPEDTGELTSGFGMRGDITSPGSLLELLAGSDAELTELGRETVRDHETTHYRVEVDVEQLGQDLSAEEQAQLRQDFGELEGPVPIEVWVGDDGRLHRYRLEMDAAAAGEPEGGTASMTFEFFDHGAELSIAPPPPDQVTQMDGLGSMMGGGDGG